MFSWLLAGLFIVAQLSQNYVLAKDPTYICYAWGDPHVQTWRLHGTALAAGQQQDCYTNGQFDLVNNNYVQYTVQTLSRYIIQASLTFKNPLNGHTVCVVTTEDVIPTEDHPHKCTNHGVSATVKEHNNHYVLTVSYIYGSVNFTTTIQRPANGNNHKYNIHVWQPQSLVATSTGQCTLNDASCTKTRSFVAEDLPKQTFTFTEAHGICQTYINAYLSNSQGKQRLLSSNTVDSIMNGCVADVMYTGDAQAAQSGLSVLMMEELTGGETSFDAIRAAIDNGMDAATMKLSAAEKESEMKLARFF